MFFQFLLIGFLFATGVGPVNIEIFRRGLTERSTNALLFHLGSVLIDGLYFIIVYFGLSFFSGSELLNAALALLGVMYLGYLGIINIIDYFKQTGFTAQTKDTQVRTASPFFAGVLINIVNPTAMGGWLVLYGVTTLKGSISLIDFFAIMFGVFINGIIIIVVTHYAKKVMSQKILRAISLLSGVALLGFSAFFLYILVGLLS